MKAQTDRRKEFSPYTPVSCPSCGKRGHLLSRSVTPEKTVYLYACTRCGVTFRFDRNSGEKTIDDAESARLRALWAKLDAESGYVR